MEIKYPWSLSPGRNFAWVITVWVKCFYAAVFALNFHVNIVNPDKTSSVKQNEATIKSVSHVIWFWCPLLLLADVHYCLPVLTGWCPIWMLADINALMSTSACWCTSLLPSFNGLMATLLADINGLMFTTACQYQWVDVHLLTLKGWCPLSTVCWCIHFCLPTLMVSCPLLLAACRHQWFDVNYSLLMYALLLASISGLISTATNYCCLATPMGWCQLLFVDVYTSACQH